MELSKKELKVVKAGILEISYFWNLDIEDKILLNKINIELLSNKVNKE